MKIVVDTNIFVSAFIVNNGNPAQILRHIDRIKITTSQEILDETEDVLHRKHIQIKYKITGKQINNYIKSLRENCTLIQPTKIVKAVKDDPDDDIVLAIAKHAKAKYIISGDPHLTKLKVYEGIKILTPAQFLIILK